MSRPSQEAVDRWHRELRYFRFTYAIGGHANDMDSLTAYLPFEDETELVEIFVRLGAPLVAFAEGEPRLEWGQTYRGDEIAGRVYPLRDFPRYKPPQRFTIEGANGFATIERKVIALMTCGAKGNFWEIVEEDIPNALRIEALLDRVGVKARRPD